MPKAGRPSKYTKELADEICERIARGELAVDISELEHMPNWSTIWRWMETNEQFRNAYLRARELQQFYFADITLRTARDASRDYQTNETTIVKDDGSITTKKEVKSDNTAVQRDKLICDNLWRLMQCLNKTFSPKIENQLTGKDGEAIVPILNVTIRKHG